MIYIIQCLCPNRHAIVAIAYDPADISHDVALRGFRAQVEQLIEKQVMNPWCGICQSRDWTYEQRRSKYRTMEEAKPEIARLELEQMLTRMVIDQRKAEKN